MKSLRDLNSASKKGIAFADPRPSTIEFSNATGVNQTASTYENRTFTAEPGSELAVAINLDQPLKYSIDLSASPSSTLTWGNLSGVGSGNLTASSSGQLYTVSNIRSVGDWDAVKSPAISVPLDSPNWVFSSNLWYNSSNTRTWNTTVNVIQLDQLTSPSDYYYPDGVTNLVTGTPDVYDLGLSDINNDNLTLKLTSSNVQVYGNLVSSGTGGVSTWHSGNATLIISGNITSLNSHLNNLYYTPAAAGLDETWYLNYQLYNTSSNYYTNKQQFIKSSIDLFLSRPETSYYTRNTSGVIAGTPSIVDSINNPNGTFTLQIYPSVVGAVTTLSSTGSGGTSSFNSSTKTLTITGTKAQVNSHLSAVTLQPGLDYQSNFYFNYRLVTSGGDISVRVQNQYVTNASEVSNTTVPRTFISNGANQIFSSDTIQITETVGGATYSLYLSSGAGKFHNGTASGAAINNASSNYVVTGNKTAINSALSNMRFYPNKDTIGSQSFTIQIVRNTSVTLVSQTISLTGTARTTPIEGTGQVVYDAYSNNPRGYGMGWFENGVNGFTPPTQTYEQCFYLKANVVIVGRGGYGNAYGGHGGGGGVVLGNAITFGSAIKVHHPVLYNGYDNYGWYKVESTNYTATASQGGEASGNVSVPRGGYSGSPTVHSPYSIYAGGAGSNATFSQSGNGITPTNISTSVEFGPGGGPNRAYYNNNQNAPFLANVLNGQGGKGGVYPNNKNPIDGQIIIKYYE